MRRLTSLCRAHLPGVLALGLALAGAGGVLTAGAAAAPRPFRGETIVYAASACFPGCPATRIVIRPSGVVTIADGRGRLRTRYLQPAAYRDLAEALRPYRPLTGGTAQTTCGRTDADEVRYRISWLGRRGTVTTLDHDYGCASPRNAVLNAILLSTSARLGVGDDERGPAPFAPMPVRPALPKPHIFYF